MTTLGIRFSAPAIGLAALLLGPLGCVSSGKYEELEADRASVEAARAALETRNQELQSRNEFLEENLEKKTEQVNEMKSTYDGLVANLEDELSSGKVEIERVRNGIQLNLAQDILFASGATQLDAQGAEVLRRVAAQLQEADARIDVVGHTDDVQISTRLRSRYPTNWELAGARAGSVVRLLQEEGIDGNRLQAVSNGPFAPRVPNDSPENRAKNRRIEIRLIPLEGATLPAMIAE
jgi:chemotaxis protein MotB